jgi:hypothetical protein
MTIQQQIIRGYQNSPLNGTARKTKEDVILHAHWADAVFGIFIGADLDKVTVANGPLEDFISGILEYGMGQTLQAESCSGNNTGSSFGVIADMSIGSFRPCALLFKLGPKANAQHQPTKSTHTAAMPPCLSPKAIMTIRRLSLL